MVLGILCVEKVNGNMEKSKEFQRRLLCRCLIPGGEWKQQDAYMTPFREIPSKDGISFDTINKGVKSKGKF